MKIIPILFLLACQSPEEAAERYLGHNYTCFRASSEVALCTDQLAHVLECAVSGRHYNLVTCLDLTPKACPKAPDCNCGGAQILQINSGASSLDSTFSVTK